jgi:hypothetical protein
MLKKFSRIQYSKLSSRHQEGYNFQKVSAILADYGFMTIRLSNDWRGADFIAQHTDGITFLKVQLKGRLTFCKKYNGRGLYVCFPYEGQWYLYPHDELQDKVLHLTTIARTDSWKSKGNYSFPHISKELRGLLKPYEL